MEDIEFYNDILIEIKNRDSLHYKSIKYGVDQIQGKDFNNLLYLICGYFIKVNISPLEVVNDYLHMINDMRWEMNNFIKTNKYSCKSQKEAYEKFYSKKEIMSYYINALFISQLLWTHHFKMLMFFKKSLDLFWFNENGENILDVGSGHGLYSYFVKKKNVINGIDVVDISDSSLKMTKMILGNYLTDYYNENILTWESNKKYDLIILGEILEHLDNPLKMLKRISSMLKKDALIWLTVPTNAPAIDHIYLFRSEEIIFAMIKKAGLQIVESIIYDAGNQITQLIGAFCAKK